MGTGGFGFFRTEISGGRRWIWGIGRVYRVVQRDVKVEAERIIHNS